MAPGLCAWLAAARGGMRFAYAHSVGGRRIYAPGRGVAGVAPDKKGRASRSGGLLYSYRNAYSTLCASGPFGGLRPSIFRRRPRRVSGSFSWARRSGRARAGGNIRGPCTMRGVLPRPAAWFGGLRRRASRTGGVGGGVRSRRAQSARPLGSRLAFPFGLAAVRWELRGRARSLDAEHQVVGFGELDGGEGVPVPGADPVPGGVKDEHGQVREPVAMDRE